MHLTRPAVIAAVAVTTTFVVGCGSSAHESMDTTPESTASATASPAASVRGEPLRILLTDDDGWDAPGITATYDALTAAGHDVTMVAPAHNQSGQSAAFDFTGKLEVVHPGGDPKIYSVDSTPVGSVMFGLNEVFKGEKPDLVVSGTNVGSNVGFDTNYSGTVGAAIVASGAYGVPAIAISTDTSYRESEVVPAYAQTADLLVEILDRGIPAIGEGTILNINYPLLKDGDTEAKGLKYTPLSSASAAAFGYEQIDETTFEIVPGRAEAQPESGTDSAELNAGYVTFTLLNADRSVPESDTSVVEDLIASLS